MHFSQLENIKNCNFGKLLKVAWKIAKKNNFLFLKDYIIVRDYSVLQYKKLKKN